MILPTDTTPETSLYYLGGRIIKLLAGKDNQDFLMLYGQLKQQVKVSLRLYVLTIDWLFLAKTVIVDSEGRVSLVHK